MDRGFLLDGETVRLKTVRSGEAHAKRASRRKYPELAVLQALSTSMRGVGTGACCFLDLPTRCSWCSREKSSFSPFFCVVGRGARQDRKRWEGSGHGTGTARNRAAGTGAGKRAMPPAPVAEGHRARLPMWSIAPQSRSEVAIGVGNRRTMPIRRGDEGEQRRELNPGRTPVLR